MAFNIFSTLNQNLQSFGGDLYDTYQAGKSKVGNVASTINTNLQNFGGDIYDVGSTIKKNVSDFGTNTYSQGKNVANTIKKNVGDYATGQINEIKAIPSQISSGIDTLQKGARDLNYQAWNAGMKALTGKNNATFSDIAPNLGEEMSRNTGKADEEKVKAFVNEIMKGGYNQEQALQILDSTLAQQPDYFNKQTYSDKIRKTAVNRGREFGKTYQDFSTGKIGFGEATLRNAGDIVGAAGGVIGDTITQIPGVTPALNAIGETVASIPGVKPGMEAYGEFAQANPRAAQNIEAITNLGLTALGSAEGQKMIGKGLEKTGQGIKKVIIPIKPYAQKGIDIATEGVKKTGSVVAAPFKSTINTARRLAGSPEEIAGTQYAIGSKGVLRNGRNLRPQTQIADEIATTNGLIRASGKKPVDVATYRSAIKDEMENIGKEINRLTGQDMSIDMSDTAKKLRERAMSDTVQTLDEEGAKELLKLADKFDRKIPITEAEDMNQFINALLKNKDITAKESVKQGYQQIVEGIRENLDNTISSIPGEFRELKKAYGALRNVYGDATAKEMVINRKALSGLYESFSAVEGFGDIVGGAGKVLTGSPGAGFADIGKGVTKNAVGRFITQKNDPNEVIRKIFAQPGKTKNIPKIKVKEQLLLPAPKAGAKQSEVFSPIIGSKSAEELSRESMKPPIVPKAKPKATTESAFKSTTVVPEKKSIVAKKESTVKTPEIKSEKVPLDTKDFIYKNLDQAEGYIKWHEKMLAVPGKSKKDIKYLQDGLEEAKREASIFKNNKGFINPSEIKKSLIPKKGVDEAKQFYDDLVYAGNSPIVAQRETAKRFGTIRAISASKAGTFGGEGAKEAPKTGWFKGADGKMKFEIDDSKANFEFPKEYRDELIKHGYEDMYNIKSGNYRLGDILQHSDLYKQYPWLENTPVSFHTEGGMRSAGEMTNGKISIALNAKDPKSVILHEIQHIIQEKEGFARGGNPESFKQGIEYYKKLADYNRDILGDIRYDKMLEKDKTSIAYKKLVKEEEEALRTYKIANEKYKELSSTSPMESYNNQAGEVESRNVQTRMNMTAKERALKSPESTEDVPRNKQIIRFKNDGTSMSIDKAGTMEMPVKRAIDEKLYHGSSSMRELKDFDLDISMQKAKQGSGIGGSFAEGPGIYLTSSKAEASGYGPKVSEFNIKGANIIEKNGTKSLSRQEVSNLLSKIDKDTLQRAIDDWGSKNDLIDNIMEQGNTYEQLMDVWASVFSQQNPKGFVNAVKGIGIDALKVPKEGTTHYVIYNPDKFVSSPKPISLHKTVKPLPTIIKETKPIIKKK